MSVLSISKDIFTLLILDVKMCTSWEETFNHKLEGKYQNVSSICKDVLALLICDVKMCTSWEETFNHKKEGRRERAAEV